MTSDPGSPGARAGVTLTEEEVVVAGKAVTVTWQVRHNDGWVRAPGYPGARVEKLERGTGTVWRTRVTLELARGTRLCRVEVRPEPRTKSALEHLTSSARGAGRRQSVRRYVVGANGELVLEPASEPK